MVNSFSFTAYGIPRPQGSKRHVGNGRLIEASRSLPEWRDNVVRAAIKQARQSEPLSGPVDLGLVFVLPKPKSARKADFAPYKLPDLDKLVRAVCDAITLAHLWSDDAQVSNLRAIKAWPSASSLMSPGVIAACCERFHADFDSHRCVDELVMSEIEKDKQPWGAISCNG